MLYSCLEQHRDGSWWHHCRTFNTREEAEKFIENWIPWDKDRPKTVFEHEFPLPESTCCTKDGGETFNFGGLELWNKETGRTKFGYR